MHAHKIWLSKYFVLYLNAIKLNCMWSDLSWKHNISIILYHIYNISLYISYNIFLKPLKVVHKEIIRAIRGACRFAHSEPLFLELGLLNLDTTHRYMTGTYVYRSLNNHLISIFYYRSSDENTRESAQNLLGFPFITSTLCRQAI